MINNMTIHSYRQCLFTLDHFTRFFSLFALLLSACTVPTPSSWTQHLPPPSQTFESKPFLHKIWEKPAPSRSQKLHIYMAGDGLPWLAKGKVAKDPSPTNPLAWRLMQADPEHAIFLGRPCYFDTLLPPCSPQYWTHGRYSQAVVTSLTLALKNIIQHNPNKKIWLIGHSGGGTLAVLVAHALRADNSLQGVITLGANLDIDAWTSHHGFNPLVHSLNPAELSKLNGIQQYHLSGAKDRNTPPFLNHRFFKNQGLKPIIFPKHRHNCCWENTWSAILRDIQTKKQTIPQRSTSPQINDAKPKAAH